MGHAVRTWCAVCLMASHSQFSEGAIPHLCMDKWNRSTPVRRRSSLTQAVRGKLIPTDLALVLSMKTRNLDVFLQYLSFHLKFVYYEAPMLSPAKLFERFRTAGTNGSPGPCLFWRASEGLLKRPYIIWSRTKIHGKPRKVLFLVGEAQLAGCLKVWVSGPL